MGLTERDRALLDFERSWWMDDGPKTDAIRHQLGLSPARYYQLLAALLTSPDAESYDPLLIRRLRRIQTRRRRERLQGRPAVPRSGR